MNLKKANAGQKVLSYLRPKIWSKINPNNGDFKAMHF